MKRTLLLAACVAMMSAANAQEVGDITMTKSTEVSITNVGASAAVNDCRQGFGMNDKFYIQDHTASMVRVLDLEGKEITTYASTANTGIGHDEAGNLILASWAFPGKAEEAPGLTFVSKDGTKTTQATLPEGVNGRMDFIGTAKGNVFSEAGATLLLQGAGNDGTQVSVVSLYNGTTSAADCHMATIDGPKTTANTSNVVNYWKAADGTDHYLFVNRSGSPADLVADGENFKGTSLTLPDKGNANGAQAFVLDGRTFVLYPATPNYQDGFAIAEIAADGTIADTPVATFAATVEANANAFQCDWLNAEAINSTTAKIYQFYPGKFLRTFTFTINDPAGVKAVNTQKAVTSTEYISLSGVRSAQPQKGVNIVVTKYADGTRKVEKSIR